MATEKKDLEGQSATTEIAIVDERTIRDKIYEVRGMKVMLDFELAEIYGYTTKRFNEQVKNNVAKFDEDFRFQLTKEEVEELSRSKKSTLNRGEGRGSNIKYLPWAFTESGIYMLMTVLRGELATQQSKALIRTFRAMKDYIIENQGLIGRNEYLQLSLQVTENVRESVELRGKITDLSDQLGQVMDKMSNVVERSEIAPFLLDLGKPEEKREYLFLNNQPMRSDVAYIKIFSEARKSIHIIDDYISIKTLEFFRNVQKGVTVTLFSDNKAYDRLTAREYADFQTEYPGTTIVLYQSCKKSHDRFIVLDYGTQDERVFLCGSSSKDSGKKATGINEFKEKLVLKGVRDLITDMLTNPPLTL